MKERNFETLEVGSWYLRRDGVIVKVMNHSPFMTESDGVIDYYDNGDIREDGLSRRYDLLKKIHNPLEDPINEIQKKLSLIKDLTGESHSVKIEDIYVYLGKNGVDRIDPCLGINYNDVIESLSDLAGEKKEVFPNYQLGDKVSYLGEKGYVFHKKINRNQLCVIFDSSESFVVYLKDIKPVE